MGDAAARDAASSDAATNDAGARDASTGDAAVDASVPALPTVRFVALGDAGEGNDAQYAVGDAIGRVCANEGCDFALYLGDNFYESGVSSVDDAQFQTKFELPYSDLSFPFYVVLGNHDYGLNGAGLEWWKGPLEVAYTAHSTKWTMPSEYYSFEREHAAFIALDTNAILLNRTKRAQGDFVDAALAATTKPWRIAYGHHPYRSNGEHGNAGHYEGLRAPLPPLVPGENVAAFFEDHLCGQLDLYLAGHDHNRQWLGYDCGMIHVVSGAGAKTTDLVFRDDVPYLYVDDTEPGFLWIELEGDWMLARFYDANAEIDFEVRVMRLFGRFPLT